jgi:hypothetical protein
LKTLKASEEKMATDKLLQEFPPVSTQAWEDGDRQGPEGRRLRQETDLANAEGLAVKPYYRAEDIAGLEFLDAAPGDFLICAAPRLDGRLAHSRRDRRGRSRAGKSAARKPRGAGAEEDCVSNVAVRNASDLECFLPTCRRFPCILKCRRAAASPFD